MGAIAQWARAAEERIKSVILAEELKVYYGGWRQGPHTVTFFLRLHRSTTTQVNKIMRLGPALETVLDGRAVRIASGAQGFELQVESPAPRTPTAESLLRHADKLSGVVGIDAHRQPAILDFEQHPVTLWVGPPGRGKSENIRAVYGQIVARVPVARAQFYIVTRKTGEYRAFSRLQATRQIADASEALELLEYIAKILMKKRGQEETKWPALFLIVDDYPALLKEDKNIAGPINMIASEGRALNIFLWIGTQAAGSKGGTGGGILEETATARIIFKPSRDDAGYRAGGVKGLGAEKLSEHKGDALLVRDGVVTRIGTAWQGETLTRLAPAKQDDPDEYAQPTPVAQPAAQPAAQPTPAHTAAQPTHTAAHRRTGLAEDVTTANGSPNGTGPATPHTACATPNAQPAAQPATPTIDGKREPTPEEAAQIAEYIRQRRAAGETTSVNHLITAVYGGKKDTDRWAWLREIKAEVDDEPAPASAYGDGKIATDEPTEPMDETELFRQQLNAGLIDLSEIRAAKAG